MLKLNNKKYVELKLTETDDASGSIIVSPEAARKIARMRFATVTQAMEGTMVDGVTPIWVGDQVVLSSLRVNDKWSHVVLADEILGFWYGTGGAMSITPVGERVVVETGFLVAGDGKHYGRKAADLPNDCGLVRETKLGEHCRLVAASAGCADAAIYADYIGERCYIQYWDSPDVLSCVLGGKSVLFVPTSKVLGLGGN